MRPPIQMFLAEQDFGLRIAHSMTLTHRSKADVWKIAQQHEWISQTGRATVPKVTEALKELIWLKAANFDEYEPLDSSIRILGAGVVEAILATAAVDRANALADIADDDCACVTGMHHIDDGCDC